MELISSFLNIYIGGFGLISVLTSLCKFHWIDFNFMNHATQNKSSYTNRTRTEPMNMLLLSFEVCAGKAQIGQQNNSYRIPHFIFRFPFIMWPKTHCFIQYVGHTAPTIQHSNWLWTNFCGLCVEMCSFAIRFGTLSVLEHLPANSSTVFQFTSLNATNGCDAAGTFNIHIYICINRMVLLSQFKIMWLLPAEIMHVNITVNCFGRWLQRRTKNGNTHTPKQTHILTEMKCVLQKRV